MRLKTLKIALLAATLLLAGSASAITSTWTRPSASGAGGWGTAANWDNGVPGPADTAVFNAAGKSDCIVNVAANVAKLQIGGSYAASVSLAASMTVSNTLSLSTANFSLGAQTLTVTNLDISNGYFNGGSGSLTIQDPGELIGLGSGSFIAPTGAITIQGIMQIGTGFNYTAGATLLFQDASIIDSIESPVNVGSVNVATDTDLTLSADTLVDSVNIGFGGSIFLQNFNLKVSGTWANFNTDSSGLGWQNNGTLTFYGNAAQSILLTGFQAFNQLVIAKTLGSTLSAPASFSVSQTISVNSGTLDLSASNATILAAQFSLSSGAAFKGGTGGLSITQGGSLSLASGSNFSAPFGAGILAIRGTMNVAAGAVFSKGSDTQLGFSGDQVTLSAGVDIGDVVLGGDNFSLNGDAKVDNLSISSNLRNMSLASHVLTVSGNWSNASTFTNSAADDGEVIFNGSGTQSMTSNPNPGNFYNVVVAQPGTGSLILGSNMSVSGTLEVQSGTLNDNQNISVLNMTVDSGASFVGSSGGLHITPGGSLTVPSGAHFTGPSANFIVEGDVNVAAGALYTGVAGMQFGTSPSSHSNLVASANIGDVTVTAGTLALSADSLVGNLEIRSTLNAAFSPGAKTLTLTGNWQNDGNYTQFHPSAGTVIFSGGAAQSINCGGGNIGGFPDNNPSFFNVSIAKSIGSTLTVVNNPLFARNLSLASGILDAKTNNAGVDIAPYGSMSVSSGASFLAPIGSNIFLVEGGLSLAPGATYSSLAGVPAYFGSTSSSSQTLQATVAMGDIRAGLSSIPANLSLTGDSLVNSVEIFNNSKFNPDPYTLTLSGNWQNDGGLSQFHPSAGNVIFSGSAAQTVNGGSGSVGDDPAFKPSFFQMTVAKTLGSTLTVANNPLLAKNLTLASGILDAKTNDKGMDIAPGGSLSIQSGAVFQAPGGASSLLIEGGLSVASGANYSYTGGHPVIFGSNYGPSQTLQSPVNIGDIRIGSSFAMPGDLSLTSDCLINSLEITNSSLFSPGSYALTLSGNWQNDGGLSQFHPSAGNVIFSGSAAQTVNGGSGSVGDDPAFKPSFFQMTVAKTLGSTLTVANNPLLAKNLTLASGILDANSNDRGMDIAPGGNLSIQSGAVFQAPGGSAGFLVEGGMSVASGATYNYTAGHPVVFESNYGPSQTLQSPVNIGDIRIGTGFSTPGDLSLTSDCLINSLEISNNSVFSPGSYTLTLNGNWQNDGGVAGFHPSAGNVIFSGSAAQTVNSGGGSVGNDPAFNPSFFQMTVAKTLGSTLTVANNPLLAKNLTLASGILDANSNDRGMDIAPGGNLSIQSGAVFQAPGGSAGFLVEGGMNVASGANYSYTAGHPVLFGSGYASSQTLQSAVNIGDIRIGTGFSTPGDLSLTSDCQINNLEISNNSVFSPGSYSLTLNGNWQNDGGVTGFHPSAGNVIFSGSAAQTVNCGSGSVGNDPAQNPSFFQMTVAKTLGSTLTVVNNPLLAKNLTLASGILDANSNDRGMDIAPGGNLSIQSGAVFQAPGGFAGFLIEGGMSVASGASYSYTAGHPILFGSGFSPSQTLQSAVNIGDIRIGTGFSLPGDLSLTSDCQINSLEISNSAFFSPGPYTLTLSGNWQNDGNGSQFHPSAGTVVFSGSAAQAVNGGAGSFGGSGNPAFFNLTVSKAFGSTLSVVSSPLFVKNLSLASGSLDGGNNAGLGIEASQFSASGGSFSGDNGRLIIDPLGSLSIASGAAFNPPSANFIIQGSLSIASGALYTPNAPVQFLNGGGPESLQAFVNVGDIQITGGSLSLAANAVAQNLSMDNQSSSSLALGPYTLSLSGNCSIFNLNPGNFDPGTGTVLFSGSGAQSVDSNQPFFNLSVSKTSGTLSAGTSLPLSITGSLSLGLGNFSSPGGSNVQASKVLVKNGAMYQGGSGNLSCSQDLKVLSGGVFKAPTGNFFVSGNLELPAGALFTPGSTLKVNGSSGLFTSAASLGAVDIQNGDSLGLSGDLFVSSLNVESSASLNLGGFTLCDSGDFSNFGNSSLGLGTLKLTGSSSQTLSGNSQIQNLVKVSAVPATLKFQDGSQQEVSSLLNLQGGPAAPLILDSASGTNPFQLKLDAGTGSSNLVYLNVHNSDASPGATLNTLDSTDSGNNHNWTFSAFSPTITQTFTVSPTMTATPSETPSATPSATPTSTPSASPSATPSATPTSTPSASPSATPSATPTSTPTATQSSTATPTPSPTASPSVTLTRTPTPDSTPTATHTPAVALSKLGRPVLVPVPARVGQPMCLFFDAAPASSTWEIYAVDRQKVADLHFANQYAQCWDTQRVAPGVYFVKVAITYADGTTKTDMIKAMVVR